MHKRQDPFKNMTDKIESLERRPESVERDRREDEDGLTWDERHRPSSFRIRPVDAERLDSQARELGLSKDALGAALIWAGLDALEAGRLKLETDVVHTEVTDKTGRVRLYSRKRARPRWANPAVADRNEQGENMTQR
jgi:hypothetical protein